MHLKLMKVVRCIFFLIVVFSLTCNTFTLAGPPYRTDDPEPTLYQHYEIVIASQVTRTSDEVEGTLPHVEINYGLAQNIQIGIRIPNAFSEVKDHSRHYGLGDIELGIKFRLLDESDTTPMISFFPSYTSISGDEKRNLGVEGAEYFLPVWIGKSWGEWTTYGGAGYRINMKDNAINSWTIAWLVQNKITEKCSLGAELFFDTRQSRYDSSTTGFNVGAIYDFDSHNHIIYSVGKGIKNTDGLNQFSSFIGYTLTF